MSTSNDITGDLISPKVLSSKGRDNYDRIFNKKPPMSNIQTDLLQAIAEAHNEADEATSKARDNVDDAITKRVKAAALVEKASRLHKQDLRGYLAPIMTGDQAKAYLSLHDAAKKRPALQDKRQLFLCGILDKQEARDTSHHKPQPTFITGVSKFLARINKETSKRPVEDWSDDDRQQMRDVLKPIVDLYGRLGA